MKNHLTKLAALFEVLGIYVAGQVLGFILASILGIRLANPLQAITASTTPADLWGITGQLLTLLFFQYGGWFTLLLAVGWWHRRRGLAQYGLTMSGRTLGFHLLAGGLLFAFSELPLRLLQAANELYPMGSQSPWHEILLQMDWSEPSFWALMAVGSYGLIPIVEELFYRGYCQTRLEEEFGPATSILATAALFYLSHSQYLVFDGYHIGLILSGLFSSIAWGYIFYRTRSLIAPIVAHMLVNIPLKGIALVVAPLPMLILCVIYWRTIAQYVAEFWALLREASPKWVLALMTALCGLFAVAFAIAGDPTILLGLLLFFVALGLEWMDKHRSRLEAAPTVVG